jgi:hypothetical protein
VEGLTYYRTQMGKAIPTGVDLAVRNLQVTRPSNPYRARSFAACRFQIHNRGQALTSGSVRVLFFLSRDKTFGNADDRQIGETRLAGLTIPALATRSFTLTAAQRAQMCRLWDVGLTGPSNYYVFAQALPTAATEVRESDNAGRTTGRFRFTGGAWVDLSLRSLRATRPASARARTFTACRFQVRNRGPALRSGTLKVEYFLSRDRTFGNSDDRKIGETRHTGVTLAAGAARSFTLNATQLRQLSRRWTNELVRSGNYYLLARVTPVTAADLRPADNRTRTASSFRYAATAR